MVKSILFWVDSLRIRTELSVCTVVELENNNGCRFLIERFPLFEGLLSDEERWDKTIELLQGKGIDLNRWDPKRRQVNTLHAFMRIPFKKI